MHPPDSPAEAIKNESVGICLVAVLQIEAFALPTRIGRQHEAHAIMKMYAVRPDALASSLGTGIILMRRLLLSNP